MPLSLAFFLLITAMIVALVIHVIGGGNRLFAARRCLRMPPTMRSSREREMNSLIRSRRDLMLIRSCEVWLQCRASGAQRRKSEALQPKRSLPAALA
ncbi:MAG: hypothetical protein EBS05_27410 [Proteobacteria bacterium]|nr:hypothetical protein [Pseudomonadota bacterium]